MADDDDDERREGGCNFFSTCYVQNRRVLNKATSWAVKTWFYCYHFAKALRQKRRLSGVIPRYAACAATPNVPHALIVLYTCGQRSVSYWTTLCSDTRKVVCFLERRSNTLQGNTCSIKAKNTNKLLCKERMLRSSSTIFPKLIRRTNCWRTPHICRAASRVTQTQTVYISPTTAPETGESGMFTDAQIDLGDDWAICIYSATTQMLFVSNTKEIF